MSDKQRPLTQAKIDDLHAHWRGEPTPQRPNIVLYILVGAITALILLAVFGTVYIILSERCMMAVQRPDDFPQLRPYARQGKPYVDELRAYLREHGQAMVEDIRAVWRRTHKITVADVCHVALHYKLNLKATFEYLEERGEVPYGTYDKVLRSGIRPMAALYEIWNEMSQQGSP